MFLNITNPGIVLFNQIKTSIPQSPIFTVKKKSVISHEANAAKYNFRSFATNFWEKNKAKTTGKRKIIFKKTKRGRRFYGCSNYPKCDFAAWKLEDIKKTS